MPILYFKDALFRLSNHFGVKCSSKWGQTNKEDLVSISHNRNFGEFLILQKMQGENANIIIHHVYKAMVVIQIFNRILGIPSSGYP